MTDKEQLMKLLVGWGLPVEDNTTAVGSMVVVEPKSGSRVVGYRGFTSEFNFNRDGAFTEMGIWG